MAGKSEAIKEMDRLEEAYQRIPEEEKEARIKAARGYYERVNTESAVGPDLLYQED